MAPLTTSHNLAAAFSDPTFLNDPYPLLARLRAEARCHWDSDLQLTFFARHADVDQLLRDRRLGRAPLQDAPPATGLPAFDLLNRHSLFDMEPPDHTRLRRLVQFAFTPARVRRLRSRIEQITSELVAKLALVETFDLIADFAEPLPVAVIAELLGIAHVDRHKLRPWSQAIVRMFELQPNAAVAAEAEQAAAAFSDYLRAMIVKRRQTPADDLMTALVFAELSQQKLSEAELVATAVLLLNAGHEATVNAIGNSMWALLQRPALLARLKAAPQLPPHAVEELLRFDAPLQLFKRWVRADLQVGACRLRRGEQVALLLGAANRDANVFALPDRVDITRTPNPHLSFGAGLHFCLGAPLARLELQLGLAALLQLPGLQLLQTPRYRPTFVIRGLEALHLRVVH